MVAASSGRDFKDICTAVVKHRIWGKEEDGGAGKYGIVHNLDTDYKQNTNNSIV